MTATARIRIALILAGLCVLGAVMLYKAANARTLGASAFAQPPAGVDCAPHWSLNLITGTNTISGQGLLNALAVVSRDEIWAVGRVSVRDSWNKPLAARWNGVRWNTIFVPRGYGNDNNLTGIAALGPNDIWAVGTYGPAPTGDGHDIIVNVPLIEHWDGMQWTMVPSPRPGAGSWLQAISAIGAKDIWAVGYYIRAEDSRKRPLALHWDGTDWKQVAMPSFSSPSLPNARLYAVAATKANDVWAVGTKNEDEDDFGGDTLIMHWDGKRWSEYPSLKLGHLLAVKAVGPANIWAVGYETNIRRHEDFYMYTLIMHWDGKRWARVPSPDPDPVANDARVPWSTLHGIIVVNSKEIWALGSYYSYGGIQQLALKWNGSVWSIASEPAMGYSYDKLNAVSISPAESIGGQLQPVVVPRSNGKCAPIPSAPLNPTARVRKPSIPGITYFDAVGHTLRGGFREYWQKHGGLAQFGYPITEEFQESAYTVQYFERARFEWHPERDPQSRVQQDVLASELKVDRNTSEAFEPHSASRQADTRYFPETMHNMAPQFVKYWESHGGAAAYGYPISEPFTEVNAAGGNQYLVQYFPRQRFEYHPELPEPYRVSLGMVGVEFARRQGWLP